MKRLRSAAGIVLALLGALALLLLLDDTARAWTFRGYVALVALAAARSVVRWTDAAGSSSVSTSDGDAASAGEDRDRRDPFAVPLLATRLTSNLARRLPFGRARRRPPLAGGAMIVQAATATAGATHHRLRPVVRAVAEERLRARHGLTVDDPLVASLVGPATWALLDPNAPAPADRLAPGIDWTDVDAVLTDLEEL